MTDETDRPLIWKGTDIARYGPLFDAIRVIARTEDEGERNKDRDEFLALYLDWLREGGNLEGKTPEEVMAHNIGYLSGYAGAEDAARIREVFDCEPSDLRPAHPDLRRGARRRGGSGAGEDQVIGQEKLAETLREIFALSDETPLPDLISGMGIEPAAAIEASEAVSYRVLVASSGRQTPRDELSDDQRQFMSYMEAAFLTGLAAGRLVGS
jgi:hypothetical protein